MKPQYLALVLLAACTAPGGGGDAGLDLTVADHCGNHVLDGDETDLDCGGSCGPCADGKACLHGADCASHSCVNNLCAGGGNNPDTAIAADAAVEGDAASPPDLAEPDLTPPPDLAAPPDLTVACVNNQQCMGLPHASGMCGPKGLCVITACDQGYGDCDGQAGNGCESYLQTDIANCGMCQKACGNVAHGGAACTAGACVIAGCDKGFANCDGLFATGCATATASDVNNCGACGHVCAAPNGTPSCTNGACGIASCDMGFADCNHKPDDGCEVAVSGDPMNCGGCMMACMTPPNSMPACMNAMCSVGMCDFGFADCDKNAANGCEVNVASDVNNCGACTNKCPAVANGTIACNTGTCGVGACTNLWGDCDKNAANGCELSLATDPNNCGACGKVCNFANGVGSCLAGQCGLTSCNPGYSDCDKNAANGCESAVQGDPKNCGACGKVCPINTPYCVGGACSAEDFPPVYLLYLIESP